MLLSSSIFQFLSNLNIFQFQFHNNHNKSRFAIHMVAEYLQIHMEQVPMEYVLRMDVHKNRRIILDFEMFFDQNFLHINELNKVFRPLHYSLEWLVALYK